LHLKSTFVVALLTPCLAPKQQAIQEHGGDTMISSPSPWRVSFDGEDRYMWQCLLYFIGLGLAPHPIPLADPAAAAACVDAETSGGIGPDAPQQQGQQRRQQRRWH